MTKAALLKVLKVVAHGGESVYHVEFDSFKSDLVTLPEAQELAEEVATEYGKIACVHQGKDHMADAFPTGEYVETEDHLLEIPDAHD